MPNTHNKQHKGNRQAEPEVTNVVSPENGTIVSHPYKNASLPEKEPSGETGKTKTTDRVMVYATVIIAIATIAYTGTAIYQLRVMAETLKEMKESGKTSTDQTARIIDEANRIADSMKDTVNQSKKSLGATIDNFRLEQRAWIGPTIISPAIYADGDKKVYIKEDKELKAVIDITNSGRTVAKKVKHVVHMYSLKSGDSFIPKFKEDELMKSRAIW